jgi:hypothetical protein
MLELARAMRQMRAFSAQVMMDGYAGWSTGR